jgi:hypothetical protein
MRKILLILLIGSFPIVTFSQTDNGSTNGSPVPTETVVEKIQQVTDTPAKSIEMKQWEERNIKAMLQISEQVEKNRAREKRNAYLRIGFGVLLLVVLIVGLMRRKAKK